jgi:hypothetical protein
MAQVGEDVITTLMGYDKQLELTTVPVGRDRRLPGGVNGSATGDQRDAGNQELLQRSPPQLGR